ncbi:hypothetical protein M407DRAFT_205700 [Tulasnella calospora MUT 4182]|uniref:Secreted protein n=1 Tax=Tulasnella calospora MUT 4182 TaxID=1051891 RepID=A0A0C3Q0Y0_9AGAM|nr:hypothetical protein M407DRAFT_205700 [Tulasnella calospora MUT 4182]
MLASLVPVLFFLFQLHFYVWDKETVRNPAETKPTLTVAMIRNSRIGVPHFGRFPPQPGSDFESKSEPFGGVGQPT